MVFCERNTLGDAEKRIDDLKTSILEIASSVCEERVRLHVFGSRMTGLAERNSDVDVYVQIGPANDHEQFVHLCFYRVINL